jgi:hypothetical protein
MVHAPEQGHNHNLDSVALNYPCPVSRLKVISHNRTKYRENGTREQKYFFVYHAYAGLQHTSWIHLWVHSLSRGGPGGHCRYPVDRVPPRTSSKSR